MNRLTVAMLGEVQVHSMGQPVSCSAKKSLGVFLYLVQTGRTHSRRDLARLFWGGGNEAAARTSLRTALQRLPAPLAERLVADRDQVGATEDIDLDTSRFEALARRGELPQLTEASQLYGGDLLRSLQIDATPEFDDWLHRERTRYQQMAQSVFNRLIAGHRERSHRDHAHAAAEREAAMAAARRWLQLEPAHEVAHRWLMQLLVDIGQREAALSQYEVCQRELAVAHGRSPAATTRELFESVRNAMASDGGVQRTSTDHSVAHAATNASVHDPDAPVTSFVGRLDELAALEGLIADPSCRLLTLHAMGGAGKSRLALALANQSATRFAQGATWVALQAVTRPDQLAIAIAAAMGAELSPRADPTTALCALLREQERLLVLDNFEQLLPAQTGQDSQSVDLVLSILRAAPRVRLVVTSREVLGLQEEWVFEVPGLPNPAPEAAMPAAPGTYPAVELFVQRARQAYLGFSAQAEWPHVVRLCRLVEGLPLAIELAAAWVRTVPCGELVRTIENEMSALSARHRNRPSRQLSLDAVVQTSWVMLNAEQQKALAQLSVFAAGFTHESARAVAAAPLRVVSALIDKALVRRSVDGRLGLHELVRQFAHQQLKQRASQLREANRRFATYFADLLGRAWALSNGPRELEGELMANAEIGNLMKASAWWPEGPEIDQVATPWLRMLMAHGHLAQFLEFASVVLVQGKALQVSTRVNVLSLRARGQCFTHAMPEATADFEAAIALGLRHGLVQATLMAKLFAAAVPYRTGQANEALTILQGIEPELMALDDKVMLVLARHLLGDICADLGRNSQAIEYLEMALTHAAELGSPLLMTNVRATLARAHLCLGRLEEGEQILREALAYLERVERRHQLAVTLDTLAVAILWRSGPDRAEEAKELAQRASSLMMQMGDVQAALAATETQGRALTALGRFDEAQTKFEMAAAASRAAVAVEGKLQLAMLNLQRDRLPQALAQARELLDSPLASEGSNLRKGLNLFGAAVAGRTPGYEPNARLWLRVLLADSELQHDLRQLGTGLLHKLSTFGGSDPHDEAARIKLELTSEVEAFLRTRA